MREGVYMTDQEEAEQTLIDKEAYGILHVIKEISTTETIGRVVSAVNRQRAGMTSYEGWELPRDL